MTPQPTAAPQTAQEKHPDAWIATESGESIEGTIVNVAFAWSDQRQTDYPVLSVQQADGTVKKVHCFSTVLYNEAMQQRPVPGEQIVITYLGVGEAKVRGQNAPKRYEFRIEGRGTEAIEKLYDRMSGQTRTTDATRPKGTPPASAPAEDEIPF